MLAPATVASGVGCAPAPKPAPPLVPQPMAFNHARHVAENLQCTDCHAGAATGERATLPPTSACLMCHMEPLGTHPDEARLQAYAESGEEIPWVQVNRAGTHVRFSHAAHVTAAKMQCAECHGDMAARTSVVDRSQVSHLDMARCKACHEKKGAKNNCMACHK